MTIFSKHSRWVGLGLGLLAGLIAGYWVGLSWNRRQPSADAAPNGSAASLLRAEMKASSGKWGTIQYWETVIEMPPQLIAESAFVTQPPKWYVGPMTADDLKSQLAGCGLAEADVRSLLSTAELLPDGGRSLFPSDDMILDFPPALRNKLYRFLGQWPQNPDHNTPTLFASDSTIHWMDRTLLNDDLIDRIQQLLYRRGNADLFSDYNLILRKVPDSRTARRFIRVMTRQRTVMGSLIVSKADDIDQLVSYWGVDNREKDVRPILESAQWSKGVNEVPLVLLLPSFARERLYRYRHVDDPNPVNCHYSTLNFFNETPDPSYVSLAACAQEIDRNYVPVTNDYRLGDVVMLMRSENEVVHTCNFLTTDFVFTKNGNSVGQPWLIVPIAKVLNLYTADEPLKVRVMRRRDLAEAALNPPDYGD